MDEGWLLARADQGGRCARGDGAASDGKAGTGEGVSSGVISVRGLLAAAAGNIGGSESAREAELLLMHALKRDRAWLYAHADDPLAAADAVQFHSLLMRRAAGEPLAYIIGHREFWSLDLAVTPDVLIPRPETELLVELALRQIVQNAQVDIADLGTGSGAIALALAHERPRARVLATDASAAALALARANAEHLHIANVEFAQGDWCAALGGAKFDLIVSNPPYIANTDAHLHQGDLRFEPRAALASGVDGLGAIRAIVREAPAHLQAGGWLLFEHGYEQGAAARELLGKSGFVEVFTARDLGKRERVSGGQSA
jgi:release factor glutamine methyltransferase